MHTALPKEKNSVSADLKITCDDLPVIVTTCPSFLFPEVSQAWKDSAANLSPVIMLDAIKCLQCRSHANSFVWTQNNYLLPRVYFLSAVLHFFFISQAYNKDIFPLF